MVSRTLIVIGGPTASGKTRVAAEVARTLGTEVVNADARQFYRAMPIGTGQPTVDELLGVPHHFIGHLEVWQDQSAQEYAHAALPVIERILDAYGVAVLSGGSGLYIDAVCFELDALPPADKEVRQRLQRMHADQGIAALQQELKQLDPEMWHTIDRNNPHRLIRAIEVCLLTGRKVSELRQGRCPRPGFTPHFIALDVERSVNYAAIDARVDDMMRRGLLEEAHALLPHRDRNALQTVGYKELFLHFDGKLSLEKAVALIKQHSRNYAKRQLTWLRREGHWHWVRPGEAVQEALRSVGR